MNNKQTVKQLVTGAVIAAAYVVLSLLSTALGLAFGPVQFRLSEVLCVLPIFTPSAVWGLTVGCIISNLFSPLGAVDLVFGTAATLLAALLTLLLKDCRFTLLPLLPPVICNAVIVGAELSIFLGEVGFFAAAAGVALGEAVVVIGCGLPLCRFLKKKNIFLQD